jgi:hypothetical protein
MTLVCVVGMVLSTTRSFTITVPMLVVAGPIGYNTSLTISFPNNRSFTIPV